MSAEAGDLVRDLSSFQLSGQSLEYAYDAELAAVLPFNVKIPFENVAEARRIEAEAMAEKLRARAELSPDPDVLVEEHVLPGPREVTILRCALIRLSPG